MKSQFLGVFKNKPKGTSQGLVALVAFSQSLDLEILEVLSNLNDSINDSMAPWFYFLWHPKRDKNISGAWLDLQTQWGPWKNTREAPARQEKEGKRICGRIYAIYKVQHTMPSSEGVTPSSGEHLEHSCLFLAQPPAWCYTNITDLFSMIQVRVSWASQRDFMVQKESWIFFPIF